MYKLKFLPSALKEWRKLADPIREQLRKKLKERLSIPRIPASRLHGFSDVYKIKLRTSGYRLVYEVDDSETTVIVLAIGKRDRGKVIPKQKEEKQIPKEGYTSFTSERNSFCLWRVPKAFTTG